MLIRPSIEQSMIQNGANLPRRVGHDELVKREIVEDGPIDAQSEGRHVEFVRERREKTETRRGRGFWTWIRLLFSTMLINPYPLHRMVVGILSNHFISETKITDCSDQPLDTPTTAWKRHQRRDKTPSSKWQRSITACPFRNSTWRQCTMYQFIE